MCILYLNITISVVTASVVLPLAGSGFPLSLLMALCFLLIFIIICYELKCLSMGLLQRLI